MVIMEDSKRDKTESKYKFFTRNSISVKLDKQNVYAHSKIVIIDSSRVITGSFNFSKAAETSNAENTLILDNKELAKHYLDNWYYRYNYVPPKKKKK